MSVIKTNVLRFAVVINATSSFANLICVSLCCLPGETGLPGVTADRFLFFPNSMKLSYRLVIHEVHSTLQLLH